MSEDMGKYKEDYIKEAEEHLQVLNTTLLKLEKNPNDKKGIDAIFRASHTLKSMSAAMGYTKIELLCHMMEDLLDVVKSGRIKLTDGIIQILFDCFDNLELGLQQIKKGEKEPAVDILVSKLKLQLSIIPKKDGKEETKEPMGEELAKKPEAIQKIESIKVNVETLDTLMNLVEELLVNKMGLDQIKESGKVDELPGALDVLGRLVGDMQFNVMKARMVPVEQIFNRFPRMVRDLAKQENKEINFIVEGHDIELDRTIIDQIGEPIVHLLRNAIDHGIESKEERKKSGKKQQSTIKLTAEREKGFAIIELEDDGAGLDLKKIKDTAINKGLIKDDVQLNDEQIINLLFDPKFSMANKVTAVSGRGVGLDVVKTKVEALGGSVKVDSKPGKGTKFRLELPLTLAIIQAMLMNVGNEIYAVPLQSIVRTVRIKDENVKGVMGNEVAVLQDMNVPIIRLHDMFDVPREKELKEDLLVIVRKGKALAGLAVDSILNEQDIIIKPLRTKIMFLLLLYLDLLFDYNPLLQQRFLGYEQHEISLLKILLKIFCSNLIMHYL